MTGQLQACLSLASKARGQQRPSATSIITMTGIHFSAQGARRMIATSGYRPLSPFPVEDVPMSVFAALASLLAAHAYTHTPPAQATAPSPGERP